uniref:Putative secreted protein n=1 Tax=Anopheles marajoara TaxID=58244 RepID=A0A2M4CBB1_9DIPT
MLLNAAIVAVAAAAAGETRPFYRREIGAQGSRTATALSRGRDRFTLKVVVRTHRGSGGMYRVGKRERERERERERGHMELG